jgi:hypothetical protein
VIDEGMGTGDVGIATSKLGKLAAVFLPMALGIRAATAPQPFGPRRRRARWWGGAGIRSNKSSERQDDEHGDYGQATVNSSQFRLRPLVESTLDTFMLICSITPQ